MTPCYQLHALIRNVSVSCRLAALAIFFALSAPASAQSPVTFQYIYDDLNQLVKVIDSSGVMIQYVYDPVGNNTQIVRSTLVPGALTIFNITPMTVPTGLTITIQGQGFSTTPSANVVKLNGFALTVVSATSTTLVVLIPANATTGTISVTVGGVTATSSSPETVLPAPIILTVAPKATLAGTPFTLTVTGANLTGATFAFLPALPIPSTSINASGTSATLMVSPAASAKGYYTLVGTNPAASSSTIPIVGFLPTVVTFNTISIPGSNPNADPDADGLTNAQELAIGTDPLDSDTDGDTFLDGLEVVFGSDPLNPLSIPVISKVLSSVGTVMGGTFSIGNQISPSTALGPLTYAVSGSTFSLRNGISPVVSFGPLTYAVSGQTFSIRNSVSPAVSSGPLTYAVSGQTFSIRNGVSPSMSLGPLTYAVSGQTFSIRNSVSPGASFGPVTFVAAGQAFSILNGVSGSGQARPGAGSLSFRVPIDPTVLAEILVRVGQNKNGKSVCLDSDGDGICDSDELVIGTNPFLADSDGDGYPDGLELVLGSDPLDPKSVPYVGPPPYVVSRPVKISNGPGGVGGFQQVK